MADFPGRSLQTILSLLLLTVFVTVMGTGCKDSAALSNLMGIDVCLKATGTEGEAGMREGDRWMASLRKPYAFTKKRLKSKALANGSLQ